MNDIDSAKLGRDAPKAFKLRGKSLPCLNPPPPGSRVSGYAGWLCCTAVRYTVLLLG